MECTCDPDEVHRRLVERNRRNDDPSDADWRVYLEQRRRYEPFDAAPDHVTVNNTGERADRRRPGNR